jgi:hypothetical protein
MSQDVDWTRFCVGNWTCSLDHPPVRLGSAQAAAHGGAGAVQLVTAWPGLPPSRGKAKLNDRKDPDERVHRHPHAEGPA